MMGKLGDQERIWGMCAMDAGYSWRSLADRLKLAGLVTTDSGSPRIMVAALECFH
jgi:hypothetical protein